MAPKTTAPEQVPPDVRHKLIGQIWQSLISQGMDSQDASDAAAVLADRAIAGYESGGELGGGKYNYEPPTADEVAEAHAKSAIKPKPPRMPAAKKPGGTSPASAPGSNGAQPPGQQPRSPAGKVTQDLPSGPPVAASSVLRLAKAYERLEHGHLEQVRSYIGRPRAESPLERVRSFAATQRDALGRHVLPWQEEGGKLNFHHSLGVDRADMPQVTGKDKAGLYHPSAEMVPKFLAELKSYGIPAEKTMMDPGLLKPTQSTGDAHAVRAMADTIKTGKTIKPIMVSQDNRVLDGHHVWAGSLVARREGHPMPDGIPVVRVGLSGQDALKSIAHFQQQHGIQSRAEGEFANPAFTPHALTDKEYDSYADRLDGHLRTAMADHEGTEFTHSPDGGKTWDPDRAAVHDQIINQLMEKYKNVPAEGKAIISGGLGGSGKTYTMNRMYPEIQAGHYAVVNPDDIKEELARRGLVPELKGMPDATPLERSALVHEESSHVAKLLSQKLQAQKKNLVWDITMSSAGGTQRRIDELRKNGYGHIHGMFIHIPVDRSVESARQRHRNGLEDFRAGRNKIGERFVPSDIQRAAERPKSGSLNREVFEQLKPQFDSWDLFDRSDMGDAKLVGTGGENGPRGSKA